MADPTESVRDPRETVFEKGARFFEKDGVLFYEFRADAGSVWGPMKATEAHKKQHPSEYAAFLASKEAPAKTGLTLGPPPGSKGPPQIANNTVTGRSRIDLDRPQHTTKTFPSQLGTQSTHQEARVSHPTQSTPPASNTSNPKKHK